MNKLHFIIFILLLLIVIVVCGLWLYGCINYGKLPISEVPSWYIPFLIK